MSPVYVSPNTTGEICNYQLPDLKDIKENWQFAAHSDGFTINNLSSAVHTGYFKFTKKCKKKVYVYILYVTYSKHIVFLYMYFVL